MRKEILPEMFNYNKFPGPDFVRVADLLKSDDYQFTVLEDHKEALDATRFGQRFSELMLKYDYIVGDWSSDQLRLKGFYEDDKPNTRKTERISRLSEYLQEYCSFGCAYFILKNDQPIQIVFEEEAEPRRKRRRRSNNRRKGSEQDKDKERSYSSNQKPQKASTKRQDRPKKRQRDQEGPTFEKIKRRRKSSGPKDDRRKERSDKKSQKKKQGQGKSKEQHFTIRKKETNK